MGSKSGSKQSEWMRLSEASEYLGIHYTTLRRWSDSGQISCFKTPGGRRRFLKSDLDVFLKQSHRPPGKQLLLPSDTTKPEIIREIKQLNMQKESWYGQVSKENQKQMAKHGRNLIGTLIQYVSRDSNAEQFLEQGRNLAANYGQLCQQSGLSMNQTVAVFVNIRHAIVDSLCEAGVVVKDSGEDTWKIYQRVNHFLDVVLVAVLDNFQARTLDSPSFLES